MNVTEGLVRQYPMLLSGGMWGTITLTYDETEVHNKKIRPFKVVEFTPFQISVIDLGEYIEKRREFTADEWLDILINSVGLNPEPLSRREKLLYLLRMVPMVEPNCQHDRACPQGDGQDLPLSQHQLLLARPLGRQGDPRRPVHQQRQRQGRRGRDP